MRGSLVASVAVLATLALGPTAQASIYWTRPSGDAIGTAATNGHDPQRALVSSPHVWEIAADRRYVYWGRLYCCAGKTNYIARARVDGSRVNQKFIMLAPRTDGHPSGIAGIAVDARHLYFSHDGGIARANLDGTGIQENFIPLPAGRPAARILVAGGFLYFRTQTLANVVSIARASIDGSGVNLDWLPLPAQGGAIAIGGGSIYVTLGAPFFSIGRARLDGTGFNPRFVQTPAQALAADAGHLYWSSFPRGQIGRMKFDGSGAHPKFVRGIGGAQALAVNAR